MTGSLLEKMIASGQEDMLVTAGIHLVVNRSIVLLPVWVFPMRVQVFPEHH